MKTYNKGDYILYCEGIDKSYVRVELNVITGKGPKRVFYNSILYYEVLGSKGLIKNIIKESRWQNKEDYDEIICRGKILKNKTCKAKVLLLLSSLTP